MRAGANVSTAHLPITPAFESFGADLVARRLGSGLDWFLQCRIFPGTSRIGLSSTTHEYG